MTSIRSPQGTWALWIAANAVGEFVGLGAVAGIGYLLVAQSGEPTSVYGVLKVATVMVFLGGIEGWVVGFAQATVLKSRLPKVKGWIRATVFGAVTAWMLGMIPSTVINLLTLGQQQAQTQTPPDISDALQLLLAAGLGFVAGPILAVFQWRVLRFYVERAGLWILANALAWAVGMPIIFWGAQSVDPASPLGSIVLTIGAALFLAGATVGAIHGAFLLKMIDDRVFDRKARPAG